MHHRGLRGQPEVVFPDSETFSPSTRLLLLWDQPHGTQTCLVCAGALHLWTGWASALSAPPRFVCGWLCYMQMTKRLSKQAS